jgi:hypothetical protein
MSTFQKSARVCYQDAPTRQDSFLNLAQFTRLLLQAQVRRVTGRDIRWADWSYNFAEDALTCQGQYEG